MNYFLVLMIKMLLYEIFYLCFTFVSITMLPF